MARYDEIFEAVRNGDRAKVLSLIDADESLLNVHDHNQSTPLTRAFAYGHIDLALSLVKRGANPFAMNHSDKWGMRYIVEKDGIGDEQRIQFTDAISQVRDAELVAHLGIASIFYAVWDHDTESAAKLLKEDLNAGSVYYAATKMSDELALKFRKAEGGAVRELQGFYNGLPYCGLTPLHYAVIAGDESTVKVLLEAGADVDAIPFAYDKTSRHTPMYFVPEGCEPIAELLIQHGANAKHSTSYLTEGSESMRKVVVAHGAGETPLLRALISKNFDQAAKIVQADPSVINDRLPNARYDTPLHMSVHADNTKLVETLLEAGMNIDTPSRDGYTALAVAPEMYCSLDMFKLLLERGADVGAGDDSPMKAAAWQHAYGHENYEEIIRLLASNGAKPRGLIHCARAGNVAFAKLLIELGADANETDELGFYNIQLGEGHTALDYCTGVVGDRECPELAEILRSHGGRLKAELQP